MWLQKVWTGWFLFSCCCGETGDATNITVSTQWDSLSAMNTTTDYPVAIQYSCTRTYNNTIQTFGGIAVWNVYDTSSATEINNGYYANVNDLFASNNQSIQSNSSWNSYQLINNSSLGVVNPYLCRSGISTMMNDRSINFNLNNLVFIGPTQENPSTLVIYDILNQFQIPFTNYTYKIPFWDTFYGSCITANETHLFLFGGSNGILTMSTFVIYDVLNDIWINTNNNMTYSRIECEAKYNDNSDIIYVIGGYSENEEDEDEPYVEQIEYYNLVTNEWNVVENSNLKYFRTGFTTLLFKTRKLLFDYSIILIIGGNDIVTKKTINATEILLISNTNSNEEPILVSLLNETNSNSNYYHLLVDFNDSAILNLFNITAPYNGIAAMSASWLNSDEYEIVEKCINDQNSNYNKTNKIRNTFIIIGGLIGQDPPYSKDIHVVNVYYQETNRPECNVANKS